MLQCKMEVGCRPKYGDNLCPKLWVRRKIYLNRCFSEMISKVGSFLNRMPKYLPKTTTFFVVNRDP